MDINLANELEASAREQHRENLNEWGEQSTEILLIALTEEIGELNEAWLQYQYEDGDVDSVIDELTDAMALFYAINYNLNVYRE